jgi:hypothetical protein
MRYGDGPSYYEPQSLTRTADDPEVRGAVLAVSDNHPSWGSRQISDHLAEQNMPVTPGVVAEVLSAR